MPCQTNTILSDFLIINIMFYIWHTLIIATFIAVAFHMGYQYGKRQNKVKATVRKS